MKEISQIKEYYIAYFDVLGYKSFINNNPEKEVELLNTVHSIITKTENTIHDINNSPIATLYGDIRIQSKVFSDNVLICIEVGNDYEKEVTRLITFMGIISDIQKQIITNYNLFVRGGITKGRMSINEVYVFGEGLIEVVEIEKATKYPRIEISPQIIEILNKPWLCSQEDLNKATLIEKRINNNEDISTDENEFYEQTLCKGKREIIKRNLIQKVIYYCDDGKSCLSYLFCLDVNSIFPKSMVEKTLEIVKKKFPYDYEKYTQSGINTEEMFDKHKLFVIMGLEKYSDYSSIAIDDIKSFEEQEKILKKYVWAMVYHNCMCERYGKPDYFINTVANCERRHMKLVVGVVNNKSDKVN